MDSGIEWLDDLTSDDYAFIGRCVACFGVLERSLGLLLNSFPGNVADDETNKAESKAANRHAGILGGTLGQHVDSVRRANERFPVSARISEQDLAKLTDLAAQRNLFCHGIWKREAEKLHVFWFDREQIKLLQEWPRHHHVPPKHMTLDSVSALSLLEGLIGLAGQLLVTAENVRAAVK